MGQRKLDTVEIHFRIDTELDEAYADIAKNMGRKGDLQSNKIRMMRDALQAYIDDLQDDYRDDMIDDYIRGSEDKKALLEATDWKEVPPDIQELRKSVLQARKINAQSGLRRQKDGK